MNNDANSEVKCFKCAKRECNKLGCSECVKSCELKIITESREKRGIPKENPESNLVGLAFSGGGIRSATFNLGILQGLATQGWLRNFDYLSTVSGGGYIGSWLAAWIRRRNQGIGDVEKELANKGLSTAQENNSIDQQHEPAPIRWLRRYSNYLTPRLGILSGDTLAFGSVYVRNLSLNLIIITAGLAAMLLLPRLIIWEQMAIMANARWTNITSLLIVSGTLWSLTLILLNLKYIENPPDPKSEKTSRPKVPFYARSIVGLIVLPLLMVMWLVANHLWLNTRLNYFCKQYLAVIYRCFAQGHDPSLDGAINANVFYFPLLTLLLTLMVTLFIGLLGHWLEDEQREWLSRLGGQLLKWALLWVALFVMALYSPIILAVAGIKVQALLASSWLTTTISGLLMAKSDHTSGYSSDNFSGNRRKLPELVAKAAPYAFSLGLLALLALGVHQLLLHLTYNADYGRGSFFGKYVNEGQGYFQEVQTLYFDQVADSLAPSLPITMMVLVGITIIFSWRVDINEFSMHLLYRNRLVRAYLGASREKRNFNPFTGFDTKDDLKLADLIVKSSENNEKGGEVKKDVYIGPYPIINATLNLASNTDLASQDRKAASFIFTPLYCGYTVKTGGDDAPSTSKLVEAYCPTTSYGGGIKLGTAFAISGAAASPNMGYHSSLGLAFLMTIFNVRLGWWLGNPARSKWRNAGPKVGLSYLFSELFGYSTDEKNYVYLSDGGHFDNLGIYELVRRQCKYIVACDAVADGGMKFNDLSRAIRHCYLDFGAEISIDLSALARNPDTNYSQTHYAIGKINYVDGTTGKLVYIKASLTGDEAVDILNYAKEHPNFPHEPTVDQWFSEPQFESYRRLGYEIAQEIATIVKLPSS